MKRHLLRLSTLWLVLVAVVTAKAESVTATWNFADADVANAAVALSGNSGTLEDNGLLLTVEASGQTIRNNGNSIQTGNPVVFKVPVQGKKDVVTVEGYPGYFAYSIAGVDATEATTTYTATAADVAQGYVEIVSKGQYIITISVTQNEDEGGDEPEVPLTADKNATWNFANADVANAAVALSGNSGTLENNGLLLTIETNGQTIRNNGNSIQTGDPVVFKVPVKTTKDEVTVEGYPGYFAYSIAGVDATEATTTYKARTSDVQQGYVEIVSKGMYIISISVLQKSTYEEKALYSTTFEEWSDLKASEAETAIEKQTRYSNEKLTFTLYNTNVNGGDTSIDLAGKFENRPTGWLSYVKNGNSSIVTSPLASITTVRFVQGATGGNRGMKLEVKGDGDADWVVISDAVANPAKWCEITAEINRTNCQLRFTNLAPAQYAYLFELEIKGIVDMGKSPMLGTFKANDIEYAAGDYFEQTADGNYAATIELSKTVAMVSESNPLKDITADNGELGTVTYESGENSCKVTIPVTANGQTANFIASFVQKPDFTLSYISPEDGKTVLTTQTVEKDSPIGHFQGDAMSDYGIPEGYAMRGWFQKATGGRKYTTEDIVTSDLNLYGLATEIETVSDSKKYVFNLGDQYFYAEDHEAFNTTGTGYWHDATHGWAFGNGDKIDLLVGPNASISFTLCQYSKAGTKLVASDAEGTKIDGVTAADGGVVTYNYTGEGGTLSFTVESEGSVYIHGIKIVNTTTTNYDRQGQWIFVKAGDASSLDAAIDAANGLNANANAEPLFIFLPDGTYDLKETVKTAISGHNISLIGQSMEKTIIVNKPDKSVEGLGKADLFQNSGSNLYMQDLTLQNNMTYTGNDCRAAVLQDAGTRTIGKNVRMLSYQDTYYSSNNKQQAYWETCDIHGTVDFICGGGDIRFQNTTISLEPRSTDGSGSRTITAPTTNTQFGYVFDGCKVVDLAEGKGTWNFGRTWQNQPTCIYLNTTLDDNAKKTIISTRWIEKGMNNTDPKLFGEYGTKDATGADITPTDNEINSHGGKFQTILNAEQAAGFAYDKMFTDWDPAQQAKQLDAPANAKYDNGTVTWTPANNGAIAYALFLNGEFVGITEGSSFNVTIDPDKDALTIRAANARGGFGPEASVSAIPSVINNVEVDNNAAGTVYNLQGIRVKDVNKGIYIMDGKKVVIK